MSQYSVKFHEDKRHAVYARDGYKCAYCGHHDETKSGGGLSLDHIVAREAGGEAQSGKTDGATNLITTCGSCNYSKQAKTPREFNAYLKGNGKNAIDWSAVRAQAKKKIDIKTGEQNATAARAFRAAKGEPVPPSAPTPTPAPHAPAPTTPAPATPHGPKPHEHGPGIHHGTDGRFTKACTASGHRLYRATPGASPGSVIEIPDLDAELAYWVPRLNIPHWSIVMRYDDDPRDPETGAQVWGYCLRQTDFPSAILVIRTPLTRADVIEALDTIPHELCHCLLAPLEGSRMAEENAVHALAPLLAELRATAPPRAQMLVKALARRWSLTARSRAEGYAKMDEEKAAAIAAIMLKLGELLAGEGVPPELKALVEQLGALATGGAAPAEIDPTAAPAELPPGSGEAGPPMAKARIDEIMAKIAAHPFFGSAPSKTDGEVKLKALEEKQASDREAAVDAVLDTRPDIKDKPRALLRELGIEKGVAKLREHLLEVTPQKAEPKTEVLTKLPAKPIRGGAESRAKASGDAKMDRMFRLMPDASEGNGFVVSDRSDGRLFTASIVGAVATVRAATRASVSRAKAKMGIVDEVAT